MKYITLVYLLIIFVMSFISITITIYDKFAAKNGKRRIPEKTLLLAGFFGGATAMFITMRIIRHKTRHMKFMVGLPLEIILHIAIIIAVVSLI